MYLRCLSSIIQIFLFIAVLLCHNGCSSRTIQPIPYDRPPDLQHALRVEITLKEKREISFSKDGSSARSFKTGSMIRRADWTWRAWPS